MQHRPINDPTTGELARFTAKIDTTGECWEWTAYKDHKGYGRFVSFLAPRLAFVWLGGNNDPGELVVRHKCHNAGCVNPEHLEATTDRQAVAAGSGFTAVNSRKTRCNLGHPLNQENTEVHKRADGRTYRECKSCRDDLRRIMAAVRSDPEVKAVIDRVLRSNRYEADHSAAT